MTYIVLALIMGLLAVAGVVCALRYMFRTEWLAGWVRGNLYVLLMCVSLLVLLCAQDIRHYRILASGTILATITLVEKSPQSFQLSLTVPTGKEASYELHGDQWELSLRILRWNSNLTVLGFLPGYRLNEIRTRFFSIEDERKHVLPAFALDESSFGFDVWKLADRLGALLPVNATTGTASFLPLKHGAIFQIVMMPAGVVAKPINDAAKAAVQAWE